MRFPILTFSLFSLLALAVAIPVVGVQQWAAKPGLEPEPEPSAEPQPAAKVRVVALGRIEPAAGVIQIGGPINERLGRLLVQDGDWVEAGDIIALLASHRERRAALGRAKQEYQAAQDRLQAETEFSQAQLRERRIDAQQAPLAQDREIAAQRAQIRSLQAEKRLADTELGRYQSLVAEGVAPRRDLEERQTRVEQLQQQIEQAQETLQKFAKARDRELANIQAQIATAQVNTERIQANSTVETLREAVNLAQAQLATTIIKSPTAGRILRVVTRPGEAIGDNGRGQGILVSLADTREMQVIAEVNEADIQTIRVGQPAKVMSRNQAFKDTLSGRVTAIGQQIFKNNVLNDDPSALSDARVIEVKVALDDSQAVAALTNLQVEVQITLPSAPVDRDAQSS